MSYGVARVSDMMRLRQHGTFHYRCAGFPRYARETRTSLDRMYRSAEGKKRRPHKSYAISSDHPRRIDMPQLPTFVQLEPVGQCNLRCQMCAIQFRTDGPPNGPLAFMAFDDFVRLVDGFAGLKELHLQ